MRDLGPRGPFISGVIVLGFLSVRKIFVAIPPAYFNQVDETYENFAHCLNLSYFVVLITDAIWPLWPLIIT